MSYATVCCRLLSPRCLPVQELSPPLVDDFVYLCDDAYTPKEVREMEADVLATLDYDINIPVAYQFLRRYAKVPHQWCRVVWVIGNKLLPVTRYF